MTRQSNTAEQNDGMNQSPPDFDAAKFIDQLSNDQVLCRFIQDRFDEMGKLVLKRNEINDKMKEIRTSLVGRDIPLHAVHMGFKLYQMSEGEVQDAIVGIAVVAKATGKDFQLSLLDG